MPGTRKPRTRKPTVSYGKARRSPGKRAEEIHPSHIPEMKKPRGLSEEAEYVEENKEWRDNTLELVREFQTEECEHTRMRILVAQTATKRLMKCPTCGDIREEKVKGGVT